MSARGWWFIGNSIGAVLLGCYLMFAIWIPVFNGPYSPQLADALIWTGVLVGIPTFVGNVCFYALAPVDGPFTGLRKKLPA